MCITLILVSVFNKRDEGRAMKVIPDVGHMQTVVRPVLGLGLSLVLALGGLPVSAFAEAIEEATTPPGDIASQQATVDDVLSLEDGLSVLPDDENSEAGIDAEPIMDAEAFDIESDSDVAADVQDDEQAIVGVAATEPLEKEVEEDGAVTKETEPITEERTSEAGAQGIAAASDDQNDALEAMASKPTLKIGKKSFTAKASGKGSGGGTWSWNGASSLTLDDYCGGAIYYGGGSLTITLKGTNRITGLARWTDADGSLYSVCADDGSITLRGAGSLTLAPTASAYSRDSFAFGVRAQNLTVDSTSLTVDFSSVTRASHLSMLGVSGLNIKNGSKVIVRSCYCKPYTSTVIYEMVDTAVISDSTFILDYTKAEHVTNSITLLCWTGLDVTNSIVKVSGGGGGIDGGVMHVTNSDITSSILVIASSFTLKQVKGAKVVNNGFPGHWGSLRLDSAGSDTVKLTHTGAASAYANGVQDVRMSISKASVAKVANQAWTGKAVKPSPKVTLGGKRLKKGTDYTLSYANNTKAGTATITVRGKGSYVGTKKITFKIVKPSISYYVHRQTYGWEDAWSKKDGAQSGTTGQSKRLEGIKIKLGSKPCSGGVSYRTHIQTYGWESTWKSNGAMSGTMGESKRLEAIQIKLTGDMAKHYDVYYRVHAQSFGWMGWAKNGAQAGTAGFSYRLESIQVVLVPKGAKAPAATYKGIERQYAKAFAQKWHSSRSSA